MKIIDPYFISNGVVVAGKYKREVVSQKETKQYWFDL